MSSFKIRDNWSGKVREYGDNCHDSLRISSDGRCLYYSNLQNGDGSIFGSLEDREGYSFVLDDGKTPSESDSPDARYGECYANIGGFEDYSLKDRWIPVSEKPHPDTDGEYVLCVSGEYENRTYDNATIFDCYFEDGKWWIKGCSIPETLEVLAWFDISDYEGE